MKNRATTIIVQSSTHTGLNAVVLTALGVYLGMVIYQGSLGSLWTELKTDVIGSGQATPHFWQWAIAAFILYWLAENDQTQPYAEPFFFIMLAVLLVSIASKNPKYLTNLTSAFNSLVGRS